MMGIYVRYADYDDYNGQCNCRDENNDPCYPVLKELNLGWNGSSTGGHLINCKSWAEKQ